MHSAQPSPSAKASISGPLENDPPLTMRPMPVTNTAVNKLPTHAKRATPEWSETPSPNDKANDNRTNAQTTAVVRTVPHAPGNCEYPASPMHVERASTTKASDISSQVAVLAILKFSPSRSAERRGQEEGPRATFQGSVLRSSVRGRAVAAPAQWQRHGEIPLASIQGRPTREVA